MRGLTGGKITPAAAAEALLLLVVAVFSPAFGNLFINFDDPGYITRNPMVRSGFHRASVRWAFTSFENANWHPLTWLSHMFDSLVFGALPLGTHLMNVIYHATAAALLFLLFRRLTGAFWPGFFAASLFAVHPLRVESVAWASERKDVLSACFWMLTILAYLAYARRPGRGRLLVVTLLFALGLMAKPMLVSLPPLLLLLDWWPLGRARGTGPAGARLGRLLLEKTSLFLLAALSAIVTFRAQVAGGAVVPLEILPLGKRLANAAVAVPIYLGKMAWPAGLAMYYARPSGGIRPATAVWAVSFLALVTAAALIARRRHPYLITGWAWYLVALFPVLGIVQVGYQPWADRYTYLPSIGITVAVVWFAVDLTRGHRRARAALLGAGAAAIFSCALATEFYLATWHDGERLFRRALAVGGSTFMMHFCLGGELLQTGRVDEAVVQYTRGLGINPFYPDGHLGMAIALDMKGNLEKAAYHYRRALQLNPRQADAHLYYANMLERSGDLAGARLHYRETLRLRPATTPAEEGLDRVSYGERLATNPLEPEGCVDPGIFSDNALYTTHTTP